MASPELFIPSIDHYEQVQEAFNVSPEQVACWGLSRINATAVQHQKYNDLRGTYGFVAPLQHEERTYYLRGLYQPENPPYPLPMPQSVYDLGKHLIWHRQELDRLSNHGIVVPEHLSVIVQDRTRWGDQGFGLFTLSQAVQGRPTDKSLCSVIPGRQKAAYDVIRSLYGYYTDSDRPAGVQPIEDIAHMRQYIGRTLIDLDPFIPADNLNELAWLSGQASSLRSKAGKQLYQTIRTTWDRRYREMRLS